MLVKQKHIKSHIRVPDGNTVQINLANFDIKKVIVSIINRKSLP